MARTHPKGLGGGSFHLPELCPPHAHQRPTRRRNAATALLQALGWFGYATDSQSARAPPTHCTDSDAPELPFCRDLDGFVYEPEPWELARQLSLERHARQRDHITGIVIYDGDCNAPADASTGEDPAHQTATENPSAVFPDEFDQRLPEEHNLGNREHQSPWGQHERAWDTYAQQWQDTPLARWAKCAGQVKVWDNIDSIPNEDEPVFFTD